MENISERYFRNLPYDTWIYYWDIPFNLFRSVHEIINEPTSRPYVDIFENDDTAAFMKIQRENEYKYE